jgi:hypothetical protein
MQARVLSNVFPAGIFLEINQGMDYSLNLKVQVITIHIIPIFFPTRFFIGIKEHVDLKKDSVKRGSVTKYLYLTSSMQPQWIQGHGNSHG